jgi:N-glycosylase/DNA lyase
MWQGVDGPNWYRIRQTEPGEYEVETNAERTQLESLLRFDQDMTGARAELARLDPRMKSIVEGLGGFRMMRPTSPHETLFCFLCTANNHLSRIGQMVQSLGAYGESFAGIHGFTRFPSVERIADLTEEELRTAGFGYRGKSIPMVAREIMRKPETWLDGLGMKSYEEVHEELKSLYSIGPKLADCIALYGLGKMEATPIDTHMWQAICRLYRPDWQGLPLTDARYREGAKLLRDRFGVLAGLAHLFLYFDNQRTWRTSKKEENRKKVKKSGPSKTAPILVKTSASSG